MLFSRNGAAPTIDPSARVAPAASVVGNVAIGAGCYIDYGAVIASSGAPVVLGEGVSVLATGVVVLQGARIGRGSRLAVGAVVHAGTVLAPCSRVGLHCVAAPDGENGVLITADIAAARDAIARADFFGRTFALDQSDQEQLHRDAAARLREEAAAWTDELVAEPARRISPEG